MIPIYICDDEQNILQTLQQELEKSVLIDNHDMEVSGAFSAPRDLLYAIESNKQRSIYFLDVDLKDSDYDGFALAAAIRKIDPRGFLIFVTTHGELALETFRHRLEAMDYIEKDWPECLSSRLRSCLREIEERLLSENREVRQVYSIHVFDEIRHIPVDEILYIETAPKQHKLVLHSNNAIIEYTGKLSEAEKSLGDSFWRIHRSYLVNRTRVRLVSQKSSMVELDNGEACPLSRKAMRDYKTI